MLHRDERGDATGIANFILALVVGAAVTWIVREISAPLLAKSANASNDQVATTTNGWLDTYIAQLPMLFLFLAFFSLIALAIYQREVLR